MENWKIVYQGFKKVTDYEVTLYLGVETYIYRVQNDYQLTP